MGQLLSSEEELSGVKCAIGNFLYRTMLEGGAVANLSVVHPLLLANEEPGAHLQAQMLQVNAMLHHSNEKKNHENITLIGSRQPIRH